MPGKAPKQAPTMRPDGATAFKSGAIRPPWIEKMESQPKQGLFINRLISLALMKIGRAGIGRFPAKYAPKFRTAS